MWKRLLFLSVVTISLHVLGLPAFAKKPSVEGSKGVNLYSISQDIALGEQVEKEQLKQFRRKNVLYDQASDAAIMTRLKSIMDKIVKVSDRPEFGSVLHYVQSPVVNAMCAPGGKIFVYRGLFDADKGLVDLKKDDEIAAVLGHEYAHATLRHVTRQLTRYQGYSVLGNIAFGVIGANVGEGAASVFSRAYSLGGMVYFPHYGRKFETEADLVGARYMAKAGYDPRTAVTLWKRAALKRKEKGKPDATSIFASHPANGERARVLESEMNKILSYYSKQGNE